MLIIYRRDSLPSWASKFKWGGVADFDIMTSPKFGQKNPKVHIVAHLLRRQDLNSSAAQRNKLRPKRIKNGHSKYKENNALFSFLDVATKPQAGTHDDAMLSCNITLKKKNTLISPNFNENTQAFPLILKFIKIFFKT